MGEEIDRVWKSALFAKHVSQYPRAQKDGSQCTVSHTELMLLTGLEVIGLLQITGQIYDLSFQKERPMRISQVHIINQCQYSWLHLWVNLFHFSVYPLNCISRQKIYPPFGNDCWYRSNFSLYIFWWCCLPFQ